MIVSIRRFVAGSTALATCTLWCRSTPMMTMFCDPSSDSSGNRGRHADFDLSHPVSPLLSQSTAVPWWSGRVSLSPIDSAAQVRVGYRGGSISMMGLRRLFPKLTGSGRLKHPEACVDSIRKGRRDVLTRGQRSLGDHVDGGFRRRGRVGPHLRQSRSWMVDHPREGGRRRSCRTPFRRVPNCPTRWIPAPKRPGRSSTSWTSTTKHRPESAWHLQEAMTSWADDLGAVTEASNRAKSVHPARRNGHQRALVIAARGERSLEAGARQLPRDERLRTTSADIGRLARIHR